MRLSTSKTSVLLLYLTSLIFLANSQSAADIANNEICHLVPGQTVDPNTYVSLESQLDTDITVSQSECVKFFRLDLSGATAGNLIVEVKLNNWSPSASNVPFPLFVRNFESVPVVYYIRDNVVDFVGRPDSNGFRNYKSYLNFIFSQSDLQGKTYVYFALYKFFSRNQYQPVTFDYTIKASITSPAFPCPNDCTSPSQGDCDQTIKKCSCTEGFWDVDCSVEADSLSESTQTTNIQANSWGYFYVQLTESMPKITATFNVSSAGSAKVRFAIKANSEDDFTIPNFYDYDIQGLKDSVSSNDFTFTKSDSSSTNEYKIVGIFNYNTDRLQVKANYNKIEDGKDDEQDSLYSTTFSLIYLIFGAIFLFNFLVATFCYIRHRMQRRRRQVGQAVPGGAGVQFNAARQNDFLTRAEVQRYFPIQNFSELKSSFSQTTCSICLEEFQGPTKCHQLYCEHIFHEACIGEWLEHHDSCPNCKSEMTKKAIKEHIKKTISEGRTGAQNAQIAQNFPWVQS